MSEHYCRDCKHFSGVHFAECRHLQSPKDMVYGWSTKAIRMRSKDASCGAGAKLFEVKEDPPKKINFMRRMFVF